MINKEGQGLSMLEKPTTELDKILENTSPGQLNNYYKENSSSLAEGKAFYYYMKDTIESKRILLKDVYSFAGVTESWGGKILTMERHTKNRDMIIRLCVAGHFSLDETNRALKLYGMTELYSRIPRDSCLIVAIHNRKYDLAEIDEMLENSGFKRLSVDEIKEEKPKKN